MFAVCRPVRAYCLAGRITVHYQATPTGDLAAVKLTFPVLTCAVALAPLLAGCSRPISTQMAVASVPKTAPPAAPAVPAKPAIDVMAVRPNELGRFPVVMYHAIGAHASNGTRYDRHGLNISPDTFRKHLQLMYDAGWYPVNMREALTARFDVPAGKIPVVLTFDDARGTQLSYRKDGTMDPDCAVAIMEEFNATHPDWPLKGSFYVLPYSKWNPVPFYQPGKETKKLQYLVSKGFELANHSTTHRRMDKMNAQTLAWEMAECIRYVKNRVPEATMDTMALPMGYVPRTDALLDVVLHGQDGKTDYQNLCILRAWGGPTLPPAHKHYDKRDILRIGVEPGYLEGWIKRLRRGGGEQPFISDGDPNFVTVPKSWAKYLGRDNLGEAIAYVYDDMPAKKVKTATKGAGKKRKAV
jgi:peptidoglycan/xylan/chitin deacetylase (PgdA/CDA1 family)